MTTETHQEQDSTCCPKCLIDQMVGVLDVYLSLDTNPATFRRNMALNLIKQAKSMDHDLIPHSDAPEAAAGDRHRYG